MCQLMYKFKIKFFWVSMVLLFFVFGSVNTMAGDFFPDDYKSFPFKEGDLLVSQGSNNKYSINKVLKIDKITLKAGNIINIQGQSFTAPVDDFLLVISSSYGESEFESIADAKQAATTGTWTITLAHVPNRAPGAALNQQLIGHIPVTEEELDTYYQWKADFDKGDAGIF